ncbi:MAG: hypothetical protein AABX07_01585 [Nanoarchaeota archaeon]
MTIITININNDKNRILGSRQESRSSKIAERQLEMVKKGLYNLKGWKFNREEIY